MGTKKTRTTSLGDALFTKTQRQVLGLLFGHPDRSYYAKEIVRLAGMGVGSVHRELEKLAAAGLLTVRQVGNQKHYQANERSPIFEELKGIVRKTFGLADVLRAALARCGDRIVLAFIYGSVAKSTDHAGSDIDLLIVSDDLAYSEVMTILADAETRLGRTVNPTIYSLEEFRSKMAADDSFVARVVRQPKIFLIGSEDDVTAA
ncbi:nucleotidyltransferase-like protein [Geothermobacter ehrlichii]|uniref:Nucleotidyltransferase-like protein n=1 Tax=Geothermobacter ehrlichii TaxID=213224 RepID=A0A5D3WIA0_9BACT|nr:nucleotidyltransferase domain-containing protein [Geothermobacter ehrlichii]TYO98562.1 nucleotidyltransferase-like protein [Geothermobacter ehrlichii]